jgi:hypothetical protein
MTSHMTSIKIFENTERQDLEDDVNKFLDGYENYSTTVNVSTFIKNQSPTYLALVTILEKIEAEITNPPPAAT